MTACRLSLARTTSTSPATASWLVPVIGLSLVAAAIAYVSGIGSARQLASLVGLTEVMFAVPSAAVDAADAAVSQAA